MYGNSGIYEQCRRVVGSAAGSFEFFAGDGFDP